MQGQSYVLRRVVLSQQQLVAVDEGKAETKRKSEEEEKTERVAETVTVILVEEPEEDVRKETW
jgi:hypothetical protein